MKDTKDIAWVGGLLEGEGCFYAMRKRNPAIIMQTTDRDTAEKAAMILGVKIHKPQRRKGKETYKLVWPLYVCGTKAIGWMMTLYQFFGERRKMKIRELLNIWKASTYSYKASNGQRQKALCHPKEFVYSNKTQLCIRCHKELKRRENGSPLFNSKEYKHRQSESVKQIWQRRFAGELPMPNYNKGG